jgi:dienelactone hydrolase
MKDHITIEGHEGAFNAYIARPRTTGASAVVVLQEQVGELTILTPNLRSLTQSGRCHISDVSVGIVVLETHPRQ